MNNLQNTLDAAIKRIQYPPEDKDYEHYVASWAFTSIASHFNLSQGGWCITPEQSDEETKKRPDIVVEKLDNGRLRPHLCVELKKRNSRATFSKALDQLDDSINHRLVRTQRDFDDDVLEVFAMVQIGLEVAFFEYYIVESDLDDCGIPHLSGFVPLTYNYILNDMESNQLDSIPANLKTLTCSYKDKDHITEMEIPCIYDITKHQDEVSDVFSTISGFIPRHIAGKNAKRMV